MPARFIASNDNVTTTSGSGTSGAFERLLPPALDCSVVPVDDAFAGLAMSCMR